ncbi:aldehyde dehydrogenase family protein [Jatrophihabitans endophyticus]|uniref:aldehyde dehydrogenase family protein n=1 Tax=Jatrophihabitans endophyticus TaxID=1206085 RepID=UPI0019FA5F49|nr:aldehyde dehydrogenase family protein [Jatrophihabitans endophyticus]MBE7188308.1 aldehyde dehydrogenase family protein [Jatrophihabitans endophyticus]
MSVTDEVVAPPEWIAVETARRAFATRRTRSLAWRQQQLESLLRMFAENTRRIEKALSDDLGKSRVEGYLTEVSAVVGEVKLTLKHLKRWTSPRTVHAPIALGTARAQVVREPLGTVLIIGPWNYPFHLLFVPLVGALAAGNAVVLKPSEVAPASPTLIAELVAAYLDPEAVQVVQGGVTETTRLLECAFDHIFYTGNGTVGSVVMAAAAKHLTPVTLELGGKSPVWVDDSADIGQVARTLAWGKFINCGQTCVAPDFVLTTPTAAPRLAAALKTAISDYYGADPRTSPDYGRIVNERHATRLAGLLSSGTAVTGGIADVDARYVAPTVLVDVDLDAPVMRDEIFGPILPIVTVPDVGAAIDAINARPKPLALYAFTGKASDRRRLLAETSSGGVAFGSVMVQLGVPALPFGGVGASGMGAYHGELSVRTFSHERAVLRKFRGPDLTRLSRPPFTARTTRLLLGSDR